MVSSSAFLVLFREEHSLETWRKKLRRSVINKSFVINRLSYDCSSHRKKIRHRYVHISKGKMKKKDARRNNTSGQLGKKWSTLRVEDDYHWSASHGTWKDCKAHCTPRHDGNRASVFTTSTLVKVTKLNQPFKVKTEIWDARSAMKTLVAIVWCFFFLFFLRPIIFIFSTLNIVSVSSQFFFCF